MATIPALPVKKLFPGVFPVVQRPIVSQRMLSCAITVYLGGLLNASVWYGTITTTDFGNGLAIARLGLSVCSVMAFTLLLLGLASFAGHIVYRLVASAMVLFSAVASYYMTLFQVVIGYGVMMGVLTTELELSRESVGWHLVLWLIPTAVLPIIAIWRVRLAHTTGLALRKRNTCWRPIVYVVSIALVLTGSIKGLEHAQAREPGPQEMASAGGMLAHRYVPSNWIAGLGMIAYHKASQSSRQLPLFDPARAFAYHMDPEREATTIVFVIGETARADHVGLLGYARDTTPLLSREKNLVAMHGWSCDSSTYLSLRCMFVREGGTGEDVARTPTERNVFATLKALGWRSDLFAMQGEIWFYNTVDADNYLLREMIAAAPGNEGKPVDDMLLVPPLAQALSTHNNKPHLVVLHTKGSHYLYTQRYPRSFARFTPECQGIDQSCSREQLVNSFDNSILYTDHVLKHIIDQVRDRQAIVFFTSDHGESIDEGTHFHATPLHMAPPEQRRVPVMVWMSDALLATRGGQSAHNRLKARAASGERVRHEELFDSILGCAGYTSGNGGINPANNWCQ